MPRTRLHLHHGPISARHSQCAGWAVPRCSQFVICTHHCVKQLCHCNKKGPANDSTQSPKPLRCGVRRIEPDSCPRPPREAVLFSTMILLITGCDVAIGIALITAQIGCVHGTCVSLYGPQSHGASRIATSLLPRSIQTTAPSSARSPMYWHCRAAK